MNLNIQQKKFTLRKSHKPESVIANSENKLLFFEKFSNFLKKKYSNKLKKLEYFYKQKSNLNESLSNKRLSLNDYR